MTSPTVSRANTAKTQEIPAFEPVRGRGRRGNRNQRATADSGKSTISPYTKNDAYELPPATKGTNPFNGEYNPKAEDGGQDEGVPSLMTTSGECNKSLEELLSPTPVSQLIVQEEDAGKEEVSPPSPKVIETPKREEEKRGEKENELRSSKELPQPPAKESTAGNKKPPLPSKLEKKEKPFNPREVDLSLFQGDEEVKAQEHPVLAEEAQAPVKEELPEAELVDIESLTDTEQDTHPGLSFMRGMPALVAKEEQVSSQAPVSAGHDDKVPQSQPQAPDTLEQDHTKEGNFTVSLPRFTMSPTQLSTPTSLIVPQGENTLPGLYGQSSHRHLITDESGDDVSDCATSETEGERNFGAIPARTRDDGPVGPSAPRPNPPNPVWKQMQRALIMLSIVGGVVLGALGFVCSIMFGPQIKNFLTKTVPQWASSVWKKISKA